MPDRNVVYLSYGNESEYRRAIFSILSFFAWGEDVIGTTRVIIYTDAPEFFKSYLGDIEIVYIFLTPEMFVEMLGEDKFIHRIKVSVIKQTFERYPEENILFLDSDTFFTSRFKELLNSMGAGKSLMHRREYTIEEGLAIFTSYGQANFPKSFIDYIYDRDFKINGEVMSFTVQDYSWNSGVLGLNADFAVYMSDLLSLTDKFYKHSEWFISEQLAFSFILQRKTEITASDDFIMHYWGKSQKILADRLISVYLAPDKMKVFNNAQTVRVKSVNLKTAVRNDMILEQVVLSVALKSWIPAIKKSIQFILTNQFNLHLYKQLLVALKPN